MPTRSRNVSITQAIDDFFATNETEGAGVNPFDNQQLPFD